MFKGCYVEKGGTYGIVSCTGVLYSAVKYNHIYTVLYLCICTVADSEILHAGIYYSCSIMEHDLQ